MSLGLATFDKLVEGDAAALQTLPECKEPSDAKVQP
jgi:hypothetical protein